MRASDGKSAERGVEFLHLDSQHDIGGSLILPLTVRTLRGTTFIRSLCIRTKSFPLTKVVPSVTQVYCVRNCQIFFFRRATIVGFVKALGKTCPIGRSGVDDLPLVFEAKFRSSNFAFQERINVFKNHRPFVYFKAFKPLEPLEWNAPFERRKR